MFRFIIKKKNKRFYVLGGIVPETMRKTSEIHHADVIFAAVKNLSNKADQEFVKWFRDIVKSENAPVVIPVHWDSFLKKLQSNCTNNGDCLKVSSMLKYALQNVENIVTQIDKNQYRKMDSFEVIEF